MLNTSKAQRFLARNAWWIFIAILFIGVVFALATAAFANGSSKQSSVQLRAGEQVAVDNEKTAYDEMLNPTTTAAANNDLTAYDEQRLSEKRDSGQSVSDPIVSDEPSTTRATLPVQTTAPMFDVWRELRDCESNGDYTRNTGNGYFGAYQFSQSTWDSMGTGYARADLAPSWVQDDAAIRLQNRSGWGQWPACARSLGLI